MARTKQTARKSPGPRPQPEAPRKKRRHRRSEKKRKRLALTNPEVTPDQPRGHPRPDPRGHPCPDQPQVPALQVTPPPRTQPEVIDLTEED
jgi:hypothetical protein